MPRVEGMALVAKGKYVCGQTAETVDVNANPQRGERGRQDSEPAERKKLAFGQGSPLPF